MNSNAATSRSEERSSRMPLDAYTPVIHRNIVKKEFRNSIKARGLASVRHDREARGLGAKIAGPLFIIPTGYAYLLQCR